MTAGLGGTLWHITILLAGDPIPLDALGRGLRRLCDLDPANMAARYRAGAVELQFWDEGSDLETVALAAAQLWRSSRQGAGLPDWSLVGLQVLERARWRERRLTLPLAMAPGSVEVLP